MIKRLTLSALALLSLTLPAAAEIRGQWKTYASFDNNPVCIIPTPTKTYFLGLAQPYDVRYSDYGDHEGFLFVYDPGADELVSYGRENYLSSTSIKAMRYNSEKRYLVIAYVDGNIDLISDDGTVRNIDALKHANISTSREPNSINFDNANGHIYIAGNFGYIVVDEGAAKVVDSRLYASPIYAAIRIGDNIILSSETGLLAAPASNKRFNLDEYNQVSDAQSVVDFMPLEGNRLAFRNNDAVSALEISGDGKSAEVKKLFSHSNIRAITDMRDGYFVCTGGSGRIVKRDGTVVSIPNTPDPEYTTITGSWDGKEIWQINPRKGLASYTLNDGKYTATRTGLYPNVPNAYRSHYGMAYSPKYGVLVNNHEYSTMFPTYVLKVPALTSGLKNGIWTSYGYPYTNPDYAKSLSEPSGLTIDPDNPDYIYYGSYFNGVQRKNLADPQDVLQLSHPSDGSSKLKGYYKLDDDDAGWADFFDFAPPRFDNEGNLWMLRQTFRNSPGLKMYVWPSAARKAGDPSQIKSWDISASNKSHMFMVVPLRHSSNKNIVLVSTGAYANQIYVIDTKGTPTDHSDDTVSIMSNLNDQDGGSITSNYVNDIVEDPATGTVWVVGSSVLYTFNPVQALKDPTRATRIKVARDDGTNLADYLLDNVTIYKMAIDSKNRKWFATNGGGIVVTSADGKTIIDEITSDNSPLPSDEVYSLVHNPDENSMVISTRHGIAEFLMSGDSSTAESNSTGVKVYPNPVRPDYLGWVTIENLPDNALVKICDAYGNLVKELGLTENGSVKWDVTNTEMKRVKSGVYHIFSSSASEGISDAPKGKILVIN